MFSEVDHLVGLVVKCLPQEWHTWVPIPLFAVDLIPGRVIPVAWKLALQWLLCQSLGILGSALGLVGLSVHCDWM